MNQPSNHPALAPTQPDGCFLAEHFQLPPLPAVVGGVLERIHSGNANAHEVAGLLSSDAALVAQVLKIVNSAYYGLPRQITEVKHAVAYLGLAEVERVALTATVMKELAPQDKEEFERFWFHSFHAALISKRLQPRLAQGADAEELHTAVLLHDIGKLVYLKFFPARYRELVRHCQLTGVLLVDAERELGCPSHQWLGSMLCDRWNLPQTIKLACERHEMAELEALEKSAEDWEEGRLVCLSNLLANLATANLSFGHKTALRQLTLGALGCDERDFLLLMAEIYELRAEAEGFLRQL